MLDGQGDILQARAERDLVAQEYAEAQYDARVESNREYLISQLLACKDGGFKFIYENTTDRSEMAFADILTAWAKNKDPLALGQMVAQLCESYIQELAEIGADL